MHSSSAGTRAAGICAAAIAVLVAVSATPSGAADLGPALTAEEFDAATVGRTLYYNSGGTPYGAEQYLSGRRVIWAFTGDDCKRGHWYEEAGEICFVYEDRPDPQCWTFHRNGRGLIAQFRGDPAGMPLVAVEESPKPMACMGPDVGV